VSFDLNSIKSLPHPQGWEDNYTRIVIFAKNPAQLFRSCRSEPHTLQSGIWSEQRGDRKKNWDQSVW